MLTGDTPARDVSSNDVGSSQAALILAKRCNRLDPEMAGKLLYVKKKWDAEE